MFKLIVILLIAIFVANSQITLKDKNIASKFVDGNQYKNL